MLFSNNSKYPIGLDISDLSLKLVQLKKQGKKIKIQALGKVSVPEGLIDNGEIKNQEEVIKIIKRLIDKPKYGKVSSDNVVACLPETRTFIKLIEITKTPNNLADVIEIEIQKHVPLLIKEIYYDWQVIEDKGDTLLVLIGAAPKEIVNQYTDLLDRAKLSVEALEIEPVALCRSLLAEESPNFAGEYKNNYAIIDIGATRTSMVVYSKNTILFTISMPISGEKITKDISDSLKISKKQAEKAKIICGLNESRTQEVINKILSRTVYDLNEKINEAFEFYNNYFSKRGLINYVLFCGGGANIKGIEKIINKSISIKIKKGDSLINLGEAREKLAKLLSIKYNLDIDSSNDIGQSSIKDKTGKKRVNNNLSIIQDSSLTFATAIGLALRGIFINKP